MLFMLSCDSRHALITCTCSVVTCMAEWIHLVIPACRKPLPVMFMRLLIEIVKKRPRTLHAFMADKLAGLISQSIWTQRAHWKGWLILAEKLMPASYPTLLQVHAWPTQSLM